jgi:signal transduction histidine kinase
MLAMQDARTGEDRRACRSSCAMPVPSAPSVHAPPPSIVRALALRVAVLVALATFGGALAVAATPHVAIGVRLAVVAIAALAVAITGSALAQRWLHRRVVVPLARFARGSLADDGASSAADDAARAPLPIELVFVDERFRRLAERLRAEQAQRARAEKLATVGHMAAGIAHEVGNPLAAIAGYAHVLRGRAAGVPGAPDLLDAMERECERIDRIVRGLLDYARPRRVTPTAVVVNDVLADVERLLADQGVLRRIDVARDLDPAAPAVFAERHEVEQVFVNLLLNAADAMGRVGRLALRTRTVPVLELRSERRRSGDAPGEYVPHRPHRRVAEWLSGATRAPTHVVQIVVADSGPGIPPDEAERVFDPFYTTKQPGRGTGLGLAIVNRVVDGLGGAIWVQRAREGGAAFVIVLPLAGAPPAADVDRRASDAAQLALFSELADPAPTRNDSFDVASD